MAAVKVLAGLVFVTLGATAIPSSAEGVKCDLSGIDLDDEVDKLLEKLPKSHFPKGAHGFQPALAGIEVSHGIVTGLNQLKRFGPVIPYCKKGSSMIQVDLVNMGAVKLTIPWRTCSGQEGEIVLNSEYSRFTVQLRVDNEGISGKFLAVSEENPISPVNTYNSMLTLEGLGDGGRIASRALSKLFPSLALELWTEAFFVMFEGALRGAVQGNNEVV